MKINLQFSDGKSNKFWKLEQKGKAFTVTYGRLGSKGQSKTKEFASPAKAAEEAEKLIGQKQRKGYAEVGAAAAKKKAAPAKQKAAPAKKKAAPAKQKAAAVTAPENTPAKKATGNKRTYEFKDAKAHKFWQATLSAKTLTLRYGGWDVAQSPSYGTTKAKTYKNPAEASAALEKACAAKAKAGYEVSDAYFSNAERASIADAQKRGLTSFRLNTHSPEALLLVCQLTKLEDLTISCRQEKVVLPDEIGDLSNLRSLSLSSCGLTKLPDSIGKLAKLDYLSCYSNKLKELPESLGKCTKLKKIVAWENKLTSVPTSIGKLLQLEELELKWNQIKTLPKEIGGAKKLRELELGDNKLTKLPAEFCKLASLEELNIESNPISELPKDFGKLRSLERLSFGHTKIKSLPESLGKITTLVELSVEGYDRMPLASLPKSLKGHKSLTTIELSNCSFKKIPECIATMPNLESIDFTDNPLHKDLLDIADDKDAVFKQLGWTQAGAVEIRSERLALPDEAEVNRIRERDKVRLEGFRRDAGYIKDEAVAKILAYVSGETDELPKIKADDARHCEGLQKLFCAFSEWSFVQERALAVCAVRWRFKTNTYYSGLYDPFCSWLNELGDDDTPTLFEEVTDRLQEYGLSQDEIIMAVLDNARDSLFVDGKVTSIGRYIARACADNGSNIIEWAKEEHAVAELFEALLREGRCEPLH